MLNLDPARCEPFTHCPDHRLGYFRERSCVSRSFRLAVRLSVFGIRCPLAPSVMSGWSARHSCPVNLGWRCFGLVRGPGGFLPYPVPVVPCVCKDDASALTPPCKALGARFFPAEAKRSTKPQVKGQMCHPKDLDGDVRHLHNPPKPKGRYKIKNALTSTNQG